VYYWGACDPNYGGQGCPAGYVADALNWAVSNLGSQGVINMSLIHTGGGFDTGVSNAIAAAFAAGHVLVAAVGNGASNQTYYPAGYSNVLGVSGLNSDLSFARQGHIASTCPDQSTYSNRGSTVDLSGPFDVYTTTPTNGYNTECGTSFATPHVVGAALIVRAVHPTWTNYEVISNLVNTAQKVGGQNYDDSTGYGLVRADLAAGIYTLHLSASQVSGHPRLSWDAVPLPGVQYRIYRRLFYDGVGSEFELWATTTSTTWTDTMSSSSYFGPGMWPASGWAVNYHIRAVSPDGYETSWESDETFIPVGVPPQ